jgi:hypothetical protein
MCEDGGSTDRPVYTEWGAGNAPGGVRLGVEGWRNQRVGRRSGHGAGASCRLKVPSPSTPNPIPNPVLTPSREQCTKVYTGLPGAYRLHPHSSQGLSPDGTLATSNAAPLRPRANKTEVRRVSQSDQAANVEGCSAGASQGAGAGSAAS